MKGQNEITASATEQNTDPESFEVLWVAAEARQAERERSRRIFESPEAQNRLRLVSHLVGLDVSVEEAIDILRAAPRESEQPRSATVAVMMRMIKTREETTDENE